MTTDGENRVRSMPPFSRERHFVLKSWEERAGRVIYAPAPTTQVASYVAETKTMEDRITPGYRRLRAMNLVLPVNGLRVKRQVVSLEPGVISQKNTFFSYSDRCYEMSGDIVVPTAWRDSVPQLSDSLDFGPSSSEVNAVSIEALATARQKMFDVMTFAAEFTKTAEMLQTTVNRYTQRVLLVEERARVVWRTSKRKTLAAQGLTSIADVFGSIWMEYRYGWTPLSFEVKALYQQILALESIYNRVRGSADSDPVIVSQSGGSPSWGEGVILGNSHISGSYYWKSSTTKRDTYQVRATAMVQMETAFQSTLDPLITAYELVPYSWMLDWFVNIGSLLRAFSPFARGTLVSSGVTVTKSRSLKTTVFVEPYSSYYRVIRNQPSTGMVELMDITRRPHVPTADLHFSADINVWRMLDVAALAMRRLDKVLRILPRLERVTLGNLVDAYNPNRKRGF